MANKKGNIKFGVGFDVDKSGLEQLKASLASLSHIDKFDLIDASADIKELNEIKTVATQVSAALQKSFNTDLGTYNIQAFKKELAKAELNISSIGKTFLGAGEKGKIAFRDMAKAISSTKLELKETHSLLDKMGETLMNTVRWSIASTALNSITGSVQKAWDFTKKLDTSLNDIRIVTEKSADEMDRFAVKANQAAKNLGANTKAYADAALIYYQQGLNDADVEARAAVTVKAANVTGQNAQAVSEQLTAVWNGYKVNAQEAESYIDKLSAVAAKTAADLEELSTGMSRVASAANIMGVDVDQLNAQLATIVSVTREAPESIGTALKTVYARMSDIEAGLDTETTLGEYTSQMAEMGINVLTAQGNLRNMGDVVEEIGNKWNTLNREQQVSLAQSIAGTRQYARMMALFDNWEMYQEALSTSQNSMGALQKQQDIYMQSLEGHLNTLTASTEKLYIKLFDADSFKDFIDIAATAIDLLANFVEGLGGGGTVLFALIPTLTNIFSKNIAQGLATTTTNLLNARENAEILDNALLSVREAIAAIDNQNIDSITQQFLTLRENLLDLRKQGLITDEQFEELGAELEKVLTLANKASSLKAERVAIDARFGEAQDDESGESITSIFEAAAAGDVENAQAKKVLYMGDVDTRKARLEGEIQELQKTFETAENEHFEARAQNLQTYMDAVVKAGETSGLVNEDEFALLKEKLKKQEEYQKKLAEYAANKNLTKKEQAELEALEKSYQIFIKNTEYVAKASTKKIVSSAQDGAKEAHKAAEVAATGVEATMDSNTKKASQKVEKNLSRINFTGLIQNITKVTSAIGQMGAAVSIIQNLGSIWKNEDLTTGEKIFQTLTNIATAASLLTPLFTTLYSLGSKNTTSNLANAASELAVAAATKKRNKAKSEVTTKSATKNTQKDTLENLGGAGKDNLISRINDAVSQGSISKQEAGGMKGALKQGKNLSAKSLAKLGVEQAGAKTAEAAGTGVAKKAGAGVLKGVTTAAKGAGTAAMGALKAVGGALASIGPVGWIAAAAIAAVTTAIVLTAKSYNKEKTALEEARKSRERATKSLADATQAYNQATGAINSYTSALKSMSELTKGTEEWEEALKNTNAQALELMKTYDGLARYAERTDDGIIQISEEGLQAIKQAEAQKLAQSQNAVLMTQQYEREAQLVYDKEMYTRKAATTDFWSVVQGIGNILLMGSFTELGGLGGDATDWGFFTQIARGENPFKDNITTDQLNKVLELDLEKILTDSDSAEAFAEKLSEQGIELEDDQLYESLYETSDELRALKEQIAENNRLTAIENAQMITNNLIARGLSQEDAALYGGMVAAQQTDAEYKAELVARTESIRNKDGSNKKLIETWAAAMGYELDDIKGVGGGKFKIKKAGSEEWEKVDYDTLAKELATAQLNAEKSTEAVIAQQRKLFTTLTDKTGQLTDNALKKILSTNDKVTAKELGNFNRKTINELNNTLNNSADLLSDIQEQAIKDTIDAMDRYLTTMESQEGWLQGTQETLTQLFKDIGETWEEITTEIDVATLQRAGALFSKISIQAGKSLADTGAQFLKTFGKEGIAKVATELDLTSTTLVADFTAMSRDLGKELDYTNKATFDFIYALAQMNGEMLVSEKTFSDIAKIVESLLEFGSALSADEFASLYSQYGSEMDNYFVRMRDGTYVLTTAAAAFSERVGELNDELLREQITKQKTAYDNTQSEIDALAASVVNLGASTREENAFTFDSLVEGATTLSYQDLKDKKKASDYGEQGLIELVKAYVRQGSTEEGTAAREMYETLREWRGEGLGEGENINDWNWEAIIGNTAGGEFSINYGAKETNKGIEKYKVYGYKPQDFANYLITAAHNKADQLYHSQEQINSLIDRGSKLGALTADEVNTLNGMFSNPDNFKVENGESPISKKVQELLSNEDKAEADIEGLERSVLSYLEGAKDVTDFEKKVQELQKDGTANVFGKGWDSILVNARKQFDAAQIVKEAEAYTQAVENLDTSFEILNARMAALESLQSSLFGQEALDNLEEQNDLLGQQILLLKERSRLSTERVSKALDFTGAAGKTENRGDVEHALVQLATELTELSETNIYNSSGDKANIIAEALTGQTGIDISTQEGYDAFIVALQSKELSDELQQYVNTITEKLGTLFVSDQEIYDLINEKLEKTLQEFELRISLQLDANELIRKYNNFIRSINEDATLAELKTPLVAEFDSYKSDVDTYLNALQDLNSMTVISQEKYNEMAQAIKDSNSELTDEQVKEMMGNIISATDFETERREILNNLMESGLSLQEAQVAMSENIVAYHEKMTEAYDEYVSLIEGANSALEHQKTLLELMYGDKAASHLADFYNQQIANQNKIMEMRKQEYDSAAAQMAVWGTLSEEEQKVVQERYLAASENYFASITDMAQMYQDQYLNTIQTAFDEFTDSFKKDEYDWIVSSSEDFLNGIEAAFGLQSVERAFDKSINANTSISAQAKLNKLREEELAKLREKDKLTKYDLDRAEKRLAVAQAEIALQEAQANKSKMRLVRGADGTYSYQYEADMDAISKAEENLAKANQDLVSLDQQELKSNYDKAWELVQEYYSKIQELDPVKDADEIAKLQEEYGARIEALGLNASAVYENLKASVAEAGEFLGQKFTIETDFAWADSDFAKAIMGFDAEGSAWTNLTAIVSGAAGILAENSQTLDANLEGAVEAYKKVVDEQLIPAAETTIDNLEDLAKPGGALDQLRNAANDAATALENAAASIQTSVALVVDKKVASSVAAGEIDSRIDFNDKQHQDRAIAQGYGGGYTYTITDPVAWNRYIDYLFGPAGTLQLSKEQKAAFSEKYDYDGDWDKFLEEITDDEFIWKRNYEILQQVLKDLGAGTFDTGGYTGAWGAEGRAAILHEKELVLNQQDTRNILAAVDIARQLENALSASLLERIVDLMTHNYTERLNELRQTAELKQDVHITAEFPNATDRNEIEAAFDELINLATQKVYEN